MRLKEFNITAEHESIPPARAVTLSSPPQMDDGKSIRYKDLYALFEHILEKTMRQEQRDWRESPVTVWVNTFKVFLDEFMTEYKPLDSTLSKVHARRHRRRFSA